MEKFFPALLLVLNMGVGSALAQTQTGGYLPEAEASRGIHPTLEIEPFASSKIIFRSIEVTWESAHAAALEQVEAPNPSAIAFAPTRGAVSNLPRSTQPVCASRLGRPQPIRGPPTLVV